MKQICPGALLLSILLAGCGGGGGGGTTPTGSIALQGAPTLSGATLSLSAVVTGVTPATVNAVVTDTTHSGVSGTSPLASSGGGIYTGSITNFAASPGDALSVTLNALDSSGSVLATSTTSVNLAPSTTTQLSISVNGTPSFSGTTLTISASVTGGTPASVTASAVDNTHSSVAGSATLAAAGSGNYTGAITNFAASSGDSVTITLNALNSSGATAATTTTQITVPVSSSNPPPPPNF